MLKVHLRQGTSPKTQYLMKTKDLILLFYLVQGEGEADSDWQGPLQGPAGWHVPWSTGVGFF